MRVSLIKDSVVKNIILVESLELASEMFPEYLCIETRFESIGSIYSEGTDSFADPAPESKSVLTKYEFISRFTNTELAAIYSRANVDSTALVFIKKLELSQEVILSNPEISQGLEYLIALGLVASNRKAVILA